MKNKIIIIAAVVAVLIAGGIFAATSLGGSKAPSTAQLERMLKKHYNRGGLGEVKSVGCERKSETIAVCTLDGMVVVDGELTYDLGDIKVVMDRNTGKVTADGDLIRHPAGHRIVKSKLVPGLWADCTEEPDTPACKR